MRIFTLSGIFWLATGAFAQKPTLKFMRHEKYLASEDGKLRLSVQIEQSYNKYGNMILQEYLYPVGNQQLRTDRKIRYSYDANGRHLNTMETNGDNLLESETKIYWDDKGNKAKVEEIRYTNGEQTSNTTTFELKYDVRGNKQSETHFGPDGSKERERVWFYNDKDEVVKSTTVSLKKTEPSREVTMVYKRNKAGDLLKTTNTEEVNGKEFRKDIQIFSNGHVIRWRKYREGKFESEFINEYRDSVVIRTTKRNTRKVIPLEKVQREQAREARKQANNNKKKKTTEIWVTNSEYDAYGNIVISTQSVNNKVMLITQHEYDDYGNCTKTVRTNKETNDKDEEDVEYETYGNVAKRVFRKNNRLVSEERFTYEYFPRD